MALIGHRVISFVWLSCLNSIRRVQRGISIWRQCEGAPLDGKLSSRRGKTMMTSTAAGGKAIDWKALTPSPRAERHLYPTHKASERAKFKLDGFGCLLQRVVTNFDLFQSIVNNISEHFAFSYSITNSGSIFECRCLRPSWNISETLTLSSLAINMLLSDYWSNISKLTSTSEKKYITHKLFFLIFT